eukprot:3334477-Pleurochrysis_carterae.AAC.1
MQKLGHLESVLHQFDQGDRRICIRRRAGHCSVDVELGYQHRSVQSMLRHFCADFRDGALESGPTICGTQRGGMDRRSTGIRHHELLGEGTLIANAFVGVVSHGNHIVLIGVVVQAVQERVQRR